MATIRSPTSPDLDQPQAAIRGTPKERRAYVAARRAAVGKADRERYVLAREATADPGLALDRSTGFRTLAPGVLPGAEPVIDRARRLIDDFGGAVPESKKDHLTTNLLSRESLSLDSPFLRLALDERLLEAVSAYLGVTPVLNNVDVWHSRYRGDDSVRSSQLFHLDSADVTQIKVFIHCTDVDLASGPLTVLDASRSKQLAKRVGYTLAQGRVADEQVQEAIGSDGQTRLTGPTGTVHLLDTSRCFHFGSRVQEGAQPRTIAVLQYLTPYAFVFTGDYRAQAPFRHLAGDDCSRRQRLALGAG